MHELFITAPLVIWKENLPANCNSGKNSPSLITPKTSVSEPPWTPHPRWTHSAVAPSGAVGTRVPPEGLAPFLPEARPLRSHLSRSTACLRIHSCIHSVTYWHLLRSNEWHQQDLRQGSLFKCLLFLLRGCFVDRNRPYSWKLTSTKIFSTTRPRGTQE